MKIKQIISIFIITLMLTGTLPMTVFAQSSIGSTSTNTTIGEDIEQGQKTQYNNFDVNDAQTQVYLTVAESDLIVSLPTTVIVSGTPDEQGKYIGKYSVGVAGDMSGDKTVNITPDSNVELQQKGKKNKTATIEQNQTLFTSDDFKNKTRTTGTVTADKLTAGSWNGRFYFNINSNEKYVYYSSLELAAKDANNLVTDNADVLRDDVERAEAALTINDNKAKIMLFKNAEDVDLIDFTQDTFIDMNEHSINFASGKGISTNNNLTLFNGTINAINPGVETSTTTTALIANKNTDATLALNNCIINTEHTSATSKNTYEIYSKGNINTDVSSQINSYGEGTSSYFFASVFVLNPTVNNVKNIKVNMNIDNAKTLRGLQSNAGELNIDNANFNLTLKSGRAYGVYQTSDNNTTITNSNIDINVDNTSSNSNYGIAILKANNVILNKNTVSIAANSTTADTYNNCIYVAGGTTTKKIVSSDNTLINKSTNAPYTNEYGYYCPSSVNTFESTNDTVISQSKAKSSCAVWSSAQDTTIDNINCQQNINTTANSYGVQFANAYCKNSKIVNSSFTGENIGTGSMSLVDTSTLNATVEHNEFNYTAHTGNICAIRAYDTMQNDCTLEANNNNITLTTQGDTTGISISDNRKIANINNNELHINNVFTSPSDANLGYIYGIKSEAINTNIDKLTAIIEKSSSEDNQTTPVNVINVIDVSDTATDLSFTNSTVTVKSNAVNSGTTIVNTQNSNVITVTNVTADSNCTSGGNNGIIADNVSEANINEFHLTGSSKDAAKFIEMTKDTTIASVENVTFNGQSTEDSFLGIIFKGKQIDISNVDIEAKSIVNFRGIGIYRNVDIGNITNATIKGSVQAGNSAYGINNSANKSIIINPTITMTSKLSTLYGLVVNGETTDITNIVSKVISENAPSTQGTYITSTNSTIRGCDIYSECVNGMSGTGLLLTSQNGLLTSTEAYPIKVYGKEWGFEYTCAGTDKYVVNNGVFTSTCHPMYVGGAMEMNNSKFYIDNTDKYPDDKRDGAVGGIYFGTSTKLTGKEEVILNNCEVGSLLTCDLPALRCLVSQRNYEVNGVPYDDISSVQINNCKLYGGKETVFGFQSGMALTDKKSAPNTTKFNVNKGTEIYVRDTSSETGYRLYSQAELASDIQTAKRTFVRQDDKRDVVDTIRTGAIAFTQYTDLEGKQVGLWTDECNVYDNR